MKPAPGRAVFRSGRELEYAPALHFLGYEISGCGSEEVAVGVTNKACLWHSAIQSTNKGMQHSQGAIRA